MSYVKKSFISQEESLVSPNPKLILGLGLLVHFLMDSLDLGPRIHLLSRLFELHLCIVGRAWDIKKEKQFSEKVGV